MQRVLRVLLQVLLVLMLEVVVEMVAARLDHRYNQTHGKGEPEQHKQHMQQQQPRPRPLPPLAAMTMHLRCLRQVQTSSVHCTWMSANICTSVVNKQKKNLHGCRPLLAYPLTS